MPMPMNGDTYFLGEVGKISYEKREFYEQVVRHLYNGNVHYTAITKIESGREYFNHPKHTVERIEGSFNELKNGEAILFTYVDQKGTQRDVITSEAVLSGDTNKLAQELFNALKSEELYCAMFLSKRTEQVDLMSLIDTNASSFEEGFEFFSKRLDDILGKTDLSEIFGATSVSSDPLA